MNTGKWQPSDCYQVLDTNGILYCETSDKDRAKEIMRPGYTLHRRWILTDEEWRLEEG